MAGPARLITLNLGSQTIIEFARDKPILFLDTDDLIAIRKARMFSLRRSLLRRLLQGREPDRSTTMKESPIDIHMRVGNDYRNWKHIAQTLFASSEILRRDTTKSVRH